MRLLLFISVQLLTINAFSQNQWTWMSGDSTVLFGGNYGTINVPAPTNKPGARYNAAGWTTSDGKL